MEWGAASEKVDFEGSRSGLVILAVAWENFDEKIFDLRDVERINARVVC